MAPLRDAPRETAAPENPEIYALMPDEIEPLTAIALGWPGDPATLAEGLREKETAPRERRAQAEFVFSGDWGSVAELG